jgi:hypothetical protein
MALIKLRNLPASAPGDFTGQNLLAVALNDESMEVDTKAFTCGELISGMMGVFSGEANYGDFKNGLRVSGELVATGDISNATSVGGENILGEGDNGEITFGGSDASSKKDIVFTHGGAETMRVDDGGVNVSPALTVNGLAVLTAGSNISTLTNDAGYITAASIPTNISHFTNDSAYLTSVDLPNVISVGTLTLTNGADNLGTFTSTTNASIDINLPKYNETEVSFMDSDKRMKGELNLISDPLLKVEKINGYNFIWNKDCDEQKAGKKDVGVLAQEIERIMPEAVKEKDGRLKVAYHKIIPLLIECIKNQEKRIKQLEDEIKC